MGIGFRTIRGAGLAFLLTMGGLELFLRTTGAVLPSFVQDDARFGRLLRPGMSLQFVNEGFYLGRVNAHGFLGPDHAPQRDHGEIRVALLGDSFVEGFQVFDRDHFRSRLERALDVDPARPVAVMNFGFSGFNFARMADYARHYVAAFDPDVVLFFVGADDFAQETTDLGPRFRAEGDSLVVDLSFRDTTAFRRKVALRASRDLSFYTLLKKCHQLVKEGQAPLIVLEKLHPRYGEPQPETDWADEPERADPARDTVNALFLRELAAWSATGRPRIAFVAKRPLGPRDTRAIGNAGFRVLDPAGEFDRLRREGVDPTWWPVVQRRGHWNQPGHAALARFLENPVRDLIAEAAANRPSEDEGT